MASNTPFDALVWRRSDFRESSRIVTLFARDRGKLQVLAKGAHRPTSPLLGKIDLLNSVRVQLAGRGELPILGRTILRHEPRGLRAPARFLLAIHLHELWDRALPDGRADPELWDLLGGGLQILERCPPAALAVVLSGLEWRFLGALGLQPSLESCAATGRPLPARAAVGVAGDGRGLLHPTAAGRGTASRLGAASRELLRDLTDLPGRRWPTLEPSSAALHGALAVLDRWVSLVLERRPRWRAAAVRAATAAGRASPRPAADR